MADVGFYGSFSASVYCTRTSHEDVNGGKGMIVSCDVCGLLSLLIIHQEVRDSREVSVLRDIKVADP